MFDLLPKSSRSADDKQEARGFLKSAALFLGELRDGLTMINMQSAFLIVSKNYTEKQAGILFFVFGMSQFLFQTPAGYLYDYTDQKVLWLSSAAVGTTVLTVLTAFFALPYGANLPLMILIKFVQGAVTSFIPPGLNSITQGVVGAAGMTSQVSINEMMNHLGTSIIVLTGSLIGYFMYPDLGLLFVVSPIACCGFLFYLNRIRAEDIDHDAARGLVRDENDIIVKKAPNPSRKYNPPTTDDIQVADALQAPVPEKPIKTTPSFNFGWQSVAESFSLGGSATLKADSPLHILRDPVLLTFALIVFLFNLSNGTVLPLVMQTLALGGGRSGILLSGLCIIVAQMFMVVSAKICGDYSGKIGRKKIFLAGLFSVPLRCLILSGLLHLRGDNNASRLFQVLILSTQVLDGVGAGVFGTMYILVTSDVSGGTGRFSMTLGITTAAMSIGGTVSGYLGEALAQDLGYKPAFLILMVLSLIPAFLYFVFMPETLPALVKANEPHRMNSIAEADDEERSESGKYTELV